MRGQGRFPQAGLTLIEFLFATSIVAFVALGVAGMFPAALRSVVIGGQMTKATSLAQEMIDILRTEAFDSLVTVYDGLDTRSLSATCPITPPVTGFADLDYNKKKWRCDLLADTAQLGGQGLPAAYGTVFVTCLNADGSVNGTTPCPTDLRRVTVTVAWDQLASRSVSLVTYVARTQ